MIKKPIHQVTSQEVECKSAQNASWILICRTALSAPPQLTLFEMAPDSIVAGLINSAFELASFDPGVITAMEKELEDHAVAKKLKRIAEQRWIEEQTGTLIDVPADETASRPQLGIGRPRIPALCLLPFVLLRAYFGGCKDERFRDAIEESISLRIFLENMGHSLPSPSTLHENLNAISIETLKRILRAQLAMTLEEELDDFKLSRGDSTDAHSASAYPTDSGTLTKLLCRMGERLKKLDRLGLELDVEEAQLSAWQEQLRRLNYQISTLTSSSAKQAERAAQEEADSNSDPCTQSIEEQSDATRKESAKERLRRQLYEELYSVAEAMLLQLREHFQAVKDRVEGQRNSPKEQNLRESFLECFAEDLESVSQGIEQSRRRVCEGKKPNAQSKMPLSVSDPSARIIEKGGRERTFGYRPQLSFSKGNLVTALIVPEGNASDRSQLVQLIEESITNTGVVPEVVTVDDGYTGLPQWQGVLDLGVETVSFCGARGKNLLGDERWESEEYSEARRARNGAESGIYALKKKVGFEELSSVGLERVRKELLEKVIAYNALKIIELRKRKYERESGMRWVAELPPGKGEAA